MAERKRDWRRVEIEKRQSDRKIERLAGVETKGRQRYRKIDRLGVEIEGRQRDRKRETGDDRGETKRKRRSER